MTNRRFPLLIRWLFSFALIALTYNPTDWNFVRWASANYETHLSVVVLLALILFILYIIFLRATLNSIGAAGMVLILAVIWVIVT